MIMVCFWRLLRNLLENPVCFADPAWQFAGVGRDAVIPGEERFERGFDFSLWQRLKEGFRPGSQSEKLPAEEVSQDPEEVEVSALPVAEDTAGDAPQAEAPQVEAPQAEAPQVEAPQVEAPQVEAPQAPKPGSLFSRLRAGLAKTQASLVGRIDTLLRGRQVVDDALLEELEEILITADLGMKTTRELMTALEQRLTRSNGSQVEQVREILQDEIRQRLRLEAQPLAPERARPFVIMVVGVNGVGKTTTIGKLANQLVGQGKKVLIGAGDTFRAAAVEQLEIWGRRAGVEVIRHAAGSDPAALAYDAIKAAQARGADVLLMDTAGLLHTKSNLMEEM